jgi:hypothetical protein
LRPELIDGVLYAPKRWESPGIVGDGFEPVERDDPEYDELFLEATGAPAGWDPVVASSWDESQHPRDPGGEGGGQWVPKGAVESGGYTKGQRIRARNPNSNQIETATISKVTKHGWLHVDFGDGRGLIRLTPNEVKDQVVAAGWVEEDHPRDPGGDQGGQFIEKGTAAEGMPAVAEKPTMGLGTPEQEAELRRKNGVPELVEQQMEADLKDFLDNADLQMRVPETAMAQILDDGEFYNQHQAKNARGLGRTEASEAKMFGLPEETAAADLPKYGYLGPDHSGVIGYGPIKVIFKDEVKDRTTFTIGDSFMLAGDVIPSPVADPSYLSANLGQIDQAATAWAGQSGVELEYGVGGSNMRYGAESEDFIANGDMWYDAIANESTSIPYAEAQIYGKLRLSDIARVEVPPEEDWDLEDPATGNPSVWDKDALREAIRRLEAAGVKVGTYDVPGDYSGEWA